MKAIAVRLCVAWEPGCPVSAFKKRTEITCAFDITLEVPAESYG